MSFVIKNRFNSSFWCAILIYKAFVLINSFFHPTDNTNLDKQQPLFWKEKLSIPFLFFWQIDFHDSTIVLLFSSEDEKVDGVEILFKFVCYKSCLVEMFYWSEETFCWVFKYVNIFFVCVFATLMMTLNKQKVKALIKNTLSLRKKMKKESFRKPGKLSPSGDSIFVILVEKYHKVTTFTP